MMRHFFAVMTACIFLSGPIAAQSVNIDIQTTINNQFDAFQAEDAPRAFSFASPTIKGIFGTADNFAAMVKNGYPMVWRPGSVRMLEQREVAGALWQRVLVTDQAGASHVLDYQMLETPDGWLINGVQLLPQSGVGA